MPSVIVMETLRKSFGNKVLFSDFSMQVGSGEMVAICGISGCGKSTLLNIMGLIEPFDAGEYSLFGEMNIRPNSSRARRIVRNELSYLFQNFALVDNMTVEENLALALYHVKQSKKEKRIIMENALEQVGLDGFLKVKVAELSGGEQQRAALARCIIKPGRLILADEPTGSLDATNRDIVISLLKSVRELGKTIVMVTHDPEVARVCTRMIALG